MNPAIVIELERDIADEEASAVMEAVALVRGVASVVPMWRREEEPVTDDELAVHVAQLAADRASVITNRLRRFQSKCAVQLNMGERVNDDVIIEWVAQGAAFWALGRHFADDLLPRLPSPVLRAGMCLAFMLATEHKRQLSEHLAKLAARTNFAEDR